MLDDIETTADVFLIIAVTVPLALLWVAVIVDLLRRRDMKVGRKAMWLAIVVITIHIGVLLYFVFRPIPPPSGKRASDKDERAFAIVSSIEQLHVQHDAGELTDDAYLHAKRHLLGLTA